MLDETQKNALRQWYRRPEILNEARSHIDAERWEDLEEFLHMRCLFPLNRTSELPDYLKKDDGTALLPSLNPRNNLEAWQDTVEIGWEVVEEEIGTSRDDVHRAISALQKDSWEAFMKSVEERKKRRGDS